MKFNVQINIKQTFFLLDEGEELMNAEQISLYFTEHPPKIILPKNSSTNPPSKQQTRPQPKNPRNLSQ